jgi:methionyl-tRNA synthetase
MLMAAGLEVPKKVFAHGWLLVGGEKMSKSKLTGIAPKDITDHFGVDAFRYYFLRAIPFGSDGSFSWEDMSARYTSELANDFGNLASRLAAMIEKYCDGVLPAVSNDPGLSTALAETVAKADAAMVSLDFQGGINAIMEFCKRVNGYVTEKEPWKLAKDPEQADKLDEVLYSLSEALRIVSILMTPIIPKEADAIRTQLNWTDPVSMEQSTWGLLPDGHVLGEPVPLFPRIEATPAESGA